MSRYTAGETALIVPVPEAEPVVGEWRARLDPSAAVGVPAHASVLHPFLPEQRIDAAALRELTGLFAAHAAFDLRFDRLGRFPGVLYLAPAEEHAVLLGDLTRAVVARWPEAPPYGGRFADVVPHLTVAQDQDDAVLDAVRADLSGRLPLRTRVHAVSLLVHDGLRWQGQARFPLGSGSASR